MREIYTAHKKQDVALVNSVTVSTGIVQLNKILELMKPENRLKYLSAGMQGDVTAFTAMENELVSRNYKVNAAKIVTGIILNDLDDPLLKMKGQETAPPSPSAKSKILLFEDDKILRTLYEAKYHQQGFDVAGYDNPTSDPVSVVLREKPDVISMDIVMPIMDGFTATELLKTDARTKGIPIVIFTNHAQHKDIDRGKALGAADYLIKAHFTPDEVVDRFRRVLNLNDVANRKL